MYEPKFLQHAFFWQQLVTLRFEIFAKQRPPTIANSKHLHEVQRSLDLKSQAYFTNCYTFKSKRLDNCRRNFKYTLQVFKLLLIRKLTYSLSNFLLRRMSDTSHWGATPHAFLSLTLPRAWHSANTYRLLFLLFLSFLLKFLLLLPFCLCNFFLPYSSPLFFKLYKELIKIISYYNKWETNIR